MAEDLSIFSGTKEEQYVQLLPSIKSILEGETDLIANLANVSAALKQQFNWHWVGFYLIKDNQLVLGPFQGPLACTRINKGKGVCGSSWERNEVIIVPDVQQFLGHIACSSLSQSEIVLPVSKGNEIIGVLDVDSIHLNDFDEIDQRYLQQVVDLIA
jgi:GAF domain-containing protein